MKKIGLRLLIMFVAIYGAGYLLPSVEISHSIAVVYLVISVFLVGLILKPIMMTLGLPLSVLTLGLFVVVINTWILMIGDLMIKGVNLGGFLNTFLITFVVALLKMILVDLPEGHKETA